MKFVALFGILPLLAASAPTQRDTGSFTVISGDGYPPVAHKPVQATGERFWLGGEPGTYCPTVVNPYCPPGKVTAFAGPYALSVLVPGGQQIYVAPSGALSFTQAHSAFIPTGSAIGPFDYTAEGRPFGQYTFTGWDADGFMGCPDNSDGPKTWQVFANIQNATVPTGDIDDCFPFEANTLPFNQGPAAWQYI
jgi:hypothetical protein